MNQIKSKVSPDIDRLSGEEEIPRRKGGRITGAQVAEEGGGLTGEARTFPSACVGDHYPAFTVRIILYQCACSGQCPCPGPLPCRLGIIPAERISLFIEPLGHIGHALRGDDVRNFRPAVNGRHKTCEFRYGSHPAACPESALTSLPP